MMTKILLQGWIQRSFIIIFTLVAIGVRISMEDDSRLGLLYSLIAFTSFFIFFITATRLPQFTHSSMAKLLPNYHRKLKHSIITVWLISLLPSLLVLPDVQVWLGFISILILMAIMFVSMIYKPIFQTIFWALFFAPLGLDYIAPELSGRSIMIVCAWLLPLVLFFAHFCLNKLVQYRGNAKHVNRLIAMTNVSMEKTLAVQENVPLHERTKLSQWWSNTHFDYYRNLLNKNSENISKHSLSDYINANLAIFCLTTCLTV